MNDFIISDLGSNASISLPHSTGQALGVNKWSYQQLPHSVSMRIASER